MLGYSWRWPPSRWVIGISPFARVRLNKSPTSSLTSGLVGYWTFDGADTTSTTITDKSGNGYSATRNGVTTVTPGRIGQALSLDGEDVTNITASGSSLNNLTQFTACAWVNPATFTNPDSDPASFIFAKVWFLSIDNSGQARFAISTTGVYSQAYSPDSLATNRWQHLCGVAYGVGTEPKLFLDGVDVSFNTDPGGGTQTSDNAHPFTIGSQHDNEYSLNYQGKVDEVRIYNRALSAGEVKSLYDLGASDKVNTAATQPGGAGLASGLAGYWKLDENTGTSAGDASINGNSGTLTNGPTWTTGQIKTGVDFDGTDDYITVADPASGVLDAVGDQYYTLSGWFNRDTATTTDTILAKSNGTADAMGYLVYLDATTDKLVFSTSNTLGNNNTLETTSAYTAPGWHHFAIIFNIPRTGGNFGQIYIDSSIQNDNAIVGGYGGSIESTRAFVIGAESDGGNPFDGKLDEIRLYNRALSADEVGQLYRLTTPTGVDTSLKGYWSFNGSDTTGTTAYDRSGAGNNGTLTNGPTITEGKLGQALSLDGSNDYVSVTDPGTSSALDFANGNSITLSTWVKPDAFDGTWGSIVGKETSNSIYSPNYAILHSNSCSGSSPCPLMFYYDSGSCNETAQQMFVTSGNVLTPGVWQFITVIYTFGTGSTVKVYVDGNEKSGSWTSGNGNVAPCQGNEPFRIGIDYDGDMFDGQIDEVRIYNRALSAKEIAALYNMGR